MFAFLLLFFCFVNLTQDQGTREEGRQLRNVSSVDWPVDIFSANDGCERAQCTMGGGIPEQVKSSSSARSGQFPSKVFASGSCRYPLSDECGLEL